VVATVVSVVAQTNTARNETARDIQKFWVGATTTLCRPPAKGGSGMGVVAWRTGSVAAELANFRFRARATVRWHGKPARRLLRFNRVALIREAAISSPAG
jgi:hypothetical protein